LSEENTEEDIEYIINAVAEVVETVRGISSFWDDLQSGKIKHFI
jgi:cysteine desulfurase